MEFTEEEARRLRHLLAGVNADPKAAASLFYGHLFRILPDARGLFVSDMTRQGDKLMATLNAVILQIDNWPAIEAQVEELGLRHVAYGVRPEHYEPTGEALRAMFTQMLGAEFFAEYEAVWNKAYDALADTMIAAIERRKTTAQDAPTAD